MQKYYFGEFNKSRVEYILILASIKQCNLQVSSLMRWVAKTCDMQVNKNQIV